MTAEWWTALYSFGTLIEKVKIMSGRPFLRFCVFCPVLSQSAVSIYIQWHVSLNKNDSLAEGSICENKTAENQLPRSDCLSRSHSYSLYAVDSFCLSSNRRVLPPLGRVPVLLPGGAGIPGELWPLCNINEERGTRSTSPLLLLSFFIFFFCSEVTTKQDREGTERGEEEETNPSYNQNLWLRPNSMTIAKQTNKCSWTLMSKEHPPIPPPKT